MPITEVDNLEHDSVNGTYNSIVQIDATHYIVAYKGSGTTGQIVTFSIDADGGNITEIDQLQHEGTFCEWNSLIKIDATHFALAYEGASSRGRIKTFSIDGSYGTITELDSLQHDATQTEYNSLILIDSTHFALAYAFGGTTSGKIKTFSIDGSHVITEMNSLTHNSGRSQWNSLVLIDSTHFILAYAGIDVDGFIKTFSIDGSFVITEIDELEHDTSEGSRNSLVLIDSTHFILAYRGTVDSDGVITTFSIDGSHIITKIDSIVFESNFNPGSLAKLDSTNFAAIFTGSFEVPVVLFSIDGGFNITEGDRLTFGSREWKGFSMVAIDSSHLIAAVGGADDDGFIYTFSIAAPAAGPATLKTLNTVATANIKTIGGTAIANVKTWNKVT